MAGVVCVWGSCCIVKGGVAIGAPVGGVVLVSCEVFGRGDRCVGGGRVPVGAPQAAVMVMSGVGPLLCSLGEGVVCRSCGMVR